MKEVIGQNPLEPEQFEQLELDQLLADHSEPVVLPRRKRKPGWRERIAATAAALALAACGSGGTASTPGPVVNGERNAPLIGGDNSGKLNLVFPFTDTWYLTGGPHSDGLSNNVRYALDFAPKAILPCPGSAPLTAETVTASESGKVVVVGNENDSTDPNHSIVEITDGGGLTVGYMHLTDITVKVGQEVNTGDPLGNPSCEIPPGGTTTGVHVHEFLEKNGQPLPITDAIFDGLTVNAGPDNYQGALTGDGKVITADVGRWTKQHPGPDGIVNEVSNSGASEIPAATPTITQTPAENPTATPEAVNQSPEDLVRDAFLKKWLSLFPGQPVESNVEGQYNYADVKIENMADWKHNLAILKAGGTSDSPLLVDYMLVDVSYIHAYRISGQLQITNIQLGIVGSLSEAGWKGSAELHESIAFRSNLWIANSAGLSFNQKNAVKWATTENNSPLPPAFSTPINNMDTYIGIGYSVKNGKTTEGSGYGNSTLTPFGKTFLPTDLMLPEKQNCEHPGIDAPCQWLPAPTIK